MPDNLTPAQRRACMRAVRGIDTTPEMIVRSALHGLACRFRLHRTDLPGKPDVVMPARSAVVFVHGCFWHGHTCPHGRKRPKANVLYWDKKVQRNRLRDRRVVRALRRLGWRVLVVWECQIKDRERLAKRLVAFLNRKPAQTKAPKRRRSAR